MLAGGDCWIIIQTLFRRLEAQVAAVRSMIRRRRWRRKRSRRESR
jgi:hypothetical protein